MHGWIHESLVALNSESEEERLLNQAINYLTEATGKRPVGYRAPAWAFSRYTIGLLAGSGFLYDSSLQAMDEPYELVSERRANWNRRTGHRLDSHRNAVPRARRDYAITGVAIPALQR